MDLKEILQFIASLWTKKVLTVQGVKLAFGNIFLAFIILIFANRIAKLITRWIARKLLTKLGIEKSILSVYQTFIYYAILGSFIVLGLTVGGIPLTIFTVLGGALAIGVGFGSQNIVNNFISGIILMMERPMKIGDVIDIDGTSGTVTSIGTRSTRLKTPDEKTYIIPNSTFLEKYLLNSTLHDSIIRTDFKFGVAYGTDVKLVEKICKKIMSEHKFIQNSPEPKVIFEDFGDNALIFQIYFWCNLDEIEAPMEVRSDVRYSILEEFKKQQIEMPCPQRDLHLKSSTPLQVVMKN